MTATPDSCILPGFEDLEISTQILIREARARDITVDVLDRKAHWLRLSRGSRVEYVKEASKTRLDSYLAFLIMEDKQMTKLLLREAGVRVPAGAQYHDLAAALSDAPHWSGRDCVVKPTTTNFGTGITVLPAADAARFADHYKAALVEAFRHAGAVIVEEFVRGEEYRFLVIGDECVAVANRVPANVRGDGRSSIRRLVEHKNADPRRGVGHVTPLEKIRLDATELAYLTAQGLTPDSIPAADARIFLRKNSNISTGGDSHDFTDQLGADFKAVAVRAAQAVHARICGVDMIIPDISASAATPDSHAILELNFNPVLYIHDYPYEGKNRRVGAKILDLLGF